MMCLWKIAFSPGLVRGLQQNLESTALSYCALLKDCSVSQNIKEGFSCDKICSLQVIGEANCVKYAKLLQLCSF